MMASKTYTVSDGEMVLTLEPAEEGGYVVTSPLDPELVTEAESLDEAFENARDAADALNESRKLRDHGCILHYHGGKHDVWLNPENMRKASAAESAGDPLPPGL
jgi:predicted RNase H-like HicB family nuclease